MAKLVVTNDKGVQVQAGKAGGKRDDKAPVLLTATITGPDGKVWGTVPLMGREFSTGSVGYYGNDKLTNPLNPECRYQTGLTLTLIGSK